MKELAKWQHIVLSELSDHRLTGHDREVWLTVRRYRDVDVGSTLLVLCAPCPAGAWHQFGTLEWISEEAIEIKLKSVRGIMWRKSDYTLHVFSIHAPSVLDEINELLNQAAANALRTHNLEHKRSWARWHRARRSQQCHSI